MHIHLVEMIGQKIMIQLKTTLLTLVALFAMTADAWADPQEELLTTVTATGETTYSQSPEGVVTVTLSDINNYNDNAGWNSNTRESQHKAQSDVT